MSQVVTEPASELVDVAKQLRVHFKLFLRNIFGHCKVPPHIILSLIYHLSLDLRDQLALLSYELCLLLDASQVFVKKVLLGRDLVFIFIQVMHLGGRLVRLEFRLVIHVEEVVLKERFLVLRQSIVSNRSLLAIVKSHRRAAGGRFLHLAWWIVSR